MNEKELRIGNWVRSVKFNVPVQVELSDFYNLCANSDGAYNDPPTDKMFAPIPLDEAWLLDFGFTRIGDCFTKGQINVEIFKDKVETMVFRSAYGFEVEGCKFVHKLQNLYFELSDEELTRKQNVK